MKKGVIYLIPSAISKGIAQANCTPQLKEVLLNTKYFVVEHTREARRFISSLKLGITIEDLNFKELNKHTSSDEIKFMLQPALDGYNIGVLSDAGCPGIADPGAEIVKKAHDANIQVVPLVGPSSILLALMASGLSGQKFRFTGYLPINTTELRNKIIALEQASIREQETQIFIETPYRSDKLLQQLISTLNPSTILTAARDLTGSEELIVSSPVSRWKTNSLIIGKAPTIFLFMAG